MQSFENAAFVLDQAQERQTADQMQLSVYPITPVLKQTSDYCGQFDSISMYTESVVPSEDVQRDIEEYRRQQKAQALEFENNFEQTNNNVQYNFKVDRVVIVGGKGGEDRDVNIHEPMSNAANEIITNKIYFDKLPKKYDVLDETKWTRMQRLMYKKKVWIPLIILLLALIAGLSYAVYFFVTLSLPSHESKGATTTKPSTEYKLVKRDAWQSGEDDSMQLSGKFKLIAPVKKIIVSKVETNTCATQAECTSFVAERQQNAYPGFDDIRENFIIAEDGTVFEGRGFEREGETTCEHDMKTCYDGKAVSVAFARKSSMENAISEEQRSAFCAFIRKEREEKNIDENIINVFHHDNLISSVAFDSNYSHLLDDCVQHFYNVPQIIRRNKTMTNNDLIDDELIRKFSKKVLITTTNSEFCGTMEKCREIVQRLNESSVNFFIGGENLIFEGNNFDLAVSESHYDTLVVALIGNYATNQPSQSLITAEFRRFLEYALVLEKLSMDYRICVLSEAPQLINEIRRTNPTRYENFCN